MLPEHLVHQVVGVHIDRGHSDMALGLAPAQRVGAEQDHITHRDRSPTKLTEQDGGTIADNDHLHAVKRHRPNGTVERAGGRRDRPGATEFSF